jgi:hypothetical protein
MVTPATPQLTVDLDLRGVAKIIGIQPDPDTPITTWTPAAGTPALPPYPNND